MSGPPRRSPWPFDGKLAGHGVMFGQREKGAALVAQQPADMANVAPPDFTYSAQSPEEGKIQPYGDLLLGFGLATQQQWEDRRSRYCIAADTSVPEPIKGPAISTATPTTVDAVNGVTGFFELGGVLYAINGRYIQKRSNDADWNTGRKDFGSGKACLDVVVLKSNNAGATEYAYCAMGDADPIQRTSDGVTYTAHAEGNLLYSRKWALIGRELHRALAVNQISKVDVDSDPFVYANWSADNTFNIGDKASPITNIVVTVQGSALFCKTDGFYTVDTVGLDHPLYPALRMAPDTDGGKAAAAWLNDVYISYREGVFRIDPEWGVTGVGPERLLGNDSPVRGRVTALAGHNTFALYAGFYNPDDDASYLLKYGSAQEGTASRGDAWHGSISEAFAGKKALCFHRSTVGAPTGHQRMYVGWSDGAISWFVLPCAANPAACDEYRFTLVDGEVHLPRWTGLFRNDEKAIKGLTTSLRGCSNQAYVQVEYRVNPAAAWSRVENTFDTNGEESADFPDDTHGTTLDLKLVLKNTTTTASPRLVGLGLEHALRRPVKLVYEFLVLAADGLVRRDGVPLRIGANRIREVVKAAASRAGSVEVVLPDQRRVKLFLKGYGERQAWDERLRKWRAALVLRGVEFAELLSSGTWERAEQLTWEEAERLTWAMLEPATQATNGTWDWLDGKVWADAEAYTWAQMEGGS